MEISLNSINLAYENKLILKDISFDIDKGSWNFIVGETGSGKSTLLQVIGCLLKQNSGKLYWQEKDLGLKNVIKSYRENLGIMFQYTEKQFFNNTVKEEIIYSLVQKKVLKEEIEKDLINVIKLLGLSENILDKSPYEISGGQKRLVALASVLIEKPTILLLDEPTAGLDLENKKIFFNILKSLNKNKVTIIQISHQFEDVLEYGDTVIILEKGRIKKNGEPKKVLKNFNVETLEFFKILNDFGIDTSSFKTIDELLIAIRGSNDDKI